MEFLQFCKSLHKLELAIGLIHMQFIQIVSSPTGQSYSNHSCSYSSKDDNTTPRIVTTAVETAPSALLAYTSASRYMVFNVFL